MRLRSVFALQAIILLDFYESDAELRLSRLRLAITSAQNMGLHRLGPDKYEDRGQSGVELSAVYAASAANIGMRGEREIKKRIWWTLVVKDWYLATEPHGHIVQPDLFNTPVPCN